MKRDNLDRVKKICDRLAYIDVRITYLQSPKEYGDKVKIEFKGKIRGGGDYQFDVELHRMKSYIIAQTIQMFQAEKAELEKELETL